MELPAVKPTLVNLPVDFFTAFKFSRGPVLGSGMSGEVVLATSLLCPKHKRAVKLLSLITADGGIKSKRRFYREADVLQRLSHPHVIKYTISAVCPEYLAICTHYCPNGTLNSKLATMTSDLCVKYFTQMACLVRYLNEKQRIGHSDIKPDNIFINEFNDAILGDFGSPVFISDGASQVPTNRIGGTRCFRAPEISSCTSVDPYKLDIYSLGVVLWCMVFKAGPTSDKVYECLKDPDTMLVVPEPLDWCLTNSLQHDPDTRLSAASILKNMHGCDILKDLIDSL